jgi:hypothetical protein
VFAVAISRFASLLDGLARNLVDDPIFQKILTQDLETGQHPNPTNHPDIISRTPFSIDPMSWPTKSGRPASILSG